MLDQLIEQARMLMMSEDAREAQRRSFAYGTAHIENEDVTRALIASAAEDEADRFAR